jgi:hypothetical protein
MMIIHELSPSPYEKPVLGRHSNFTCLKVSCGGVSTCCWTGPPCVAGKHGDADGWLNLLKWVDAMVHGRCHIAIYLTWIVLVMTIEHVNFG